jgi:hypothetical protein
MSVTDLCPEYGISAETSAGTRALVFVSEVFRNEEIGLEQMDEDVHRVFFCNTELGEFNSSEMRFRPAIRA